MKETVVPVVLFCPILAHAADRGVAGGDILYTATATAAAEDQSGWLAQQAAIRALVMECKTPVQGIKVWKKDVVKNAQGFQATVQVGLFSEECADAIVAAKLSKYEQARFIDQQVVNDQAAYDRYLEATNHASAPTLNLAKYLKPEIAKQNKKINTIDAKLDAIKQQIDRTPSNTIVIHMEVPKISKAQDECQREYNLLWKKAERAAQDNAPPGNMAQIDAAEYMNDAFRALAECQ